MAADKKTSRDFTAVQERRKGRTLKRMEELEARTKCAICEKLGHWKRECPDNPERKGAPVFMAFLEGARVHSRYVRSALGPRCGAKRRCGRLCQHGKPCVWPRLGHHRSCLRTCGKCVRDGPNKNEFKNDKDELFCGVCNKEDDTNRATVPESYVWHLRLSMVVCAISGLPASKNIHPST